MTSNIPDFIHPALGGIVAALSAASYKVAQAVETVPPNVKGWMEFGGTLGFISGLIYACVTLWKELQNSRKENAELNNKIQAFWQAQSDKLISVLEKLDPDDKN